MQINSELFNFFQASTLVMFLYIVIFYLIYSRKLKRKSEYEDKKKYTFNFCLNDPFNYELYISMKDEIKSKLGHEDNLQFNNEILKILNNFEKIAIGLNLNIFDEEVIKQYYKSNFIRFYKTYKYGIDNLRERNKAPSLLIEYEKLVRSWINDYSTDFSVDFTVREI